MSHFKPVRLLRQEQSDRNPPKWSPAADAPPGTAPRRWDYGYQSRLTRYPHLERTAPVRTDPDPQPAFSGGVNRVEHLLLRDRTVTPTQSMILSEVLNMTAAGRPFELADRTIAQVIGRSLSAVTHALSDLMRRHFLRRVSRNRKRQLEFVPGGVIQTEIRLRHFSALEESQSPAKKDKKMPAAQNGRPAGLEPPSASGGGKPNPPAQAPSMPSPPASGPPPGRPGAATPPEGLAPPAPHERDKRPKCATVAADGAFAALVRDHARKRRCVLFTAARWWAEAAAVLRRRLEAAGRDPGELAAVWRWYAANHDNPAYKLPAVKNCKEFGDRWDWIFGVYERACRRTQAVVDARKPQHVKLYTEVLALDWPHGPPKDAADAVRISAERIDRFLEILTARGLTLAAKRVSGVEWTGGVYFRGLHDRLRRWRQWSGRLAGHEWDPRKDQEARNAVCAAHGPDAWDAVLADYYGVAHGDSGDAGAGGVAGAPAAVGAADGPGGALRRGPGEPAGDLQQPRNRPRSEFGYRPLD